tara:strand:- start:452 stop:1150 length:699 start_codon:yes stop_codon:yes gene_type:complete
MLIRIIYIYISFLLVHNCSNAQLNNNKSNFKDDRYSFGGFLNFDQGEFDFEVLSNIKNKYGFYGNIWVSQIDFDNSTSTQNYFSLGYNRIINESLSLDLGYAQNFSINEKENEIPEIFAGINYNAISLWAFLAENSISLESWYKPGFNFLDNNNLDLLFYGFFNNDGYDLSLNISRQFSSSIIFGFMFGYEDYSNEETFSYQKYNEIKVYTFDSGYSGWNSLLYLGLLIGIK